MANVNKGRYCICVRGRGQTGKGLGVVSRGFDKLEDCRAHRTTFSGKTAIYRFVFKVPPEFIEGDVLFPGFPNNDGAKNEQEEARK